MDYEKARDAVYRIVGEAEANRASAANLRLVVNHLMVELALWQESARGNEQRRSELFRLVNSGELRVSTSASGSVVERV